MTERTRGVDVYWLPYCSTCTKAIAHLQERGISIRSYHNLKEEPLSEDEVRALAAKVGGIEKLFSKRAMKYRQMGLHEQTLSEDDFVRLMAEEYTFITRPVIVRGDRGVLGEAGRRVEQLAVSPRLRVQAGPGIRDVQERRRDAGGVHAEDAAGRADRPGIPRAGFLGLQHCTPEVAGIASSLLYLLAEVSRRNA